jgi:hypothetical protein
MAVIEERRADEKRIMENIIPFLGIEFSNRRQEVFLRVAEINHKQSSQSMHRIPK